MQIHFEHHQACAETTSWLKCGGIATAICKGLGLGGDYIKDALEEHGTVVLHNDGHTAVDDRIEHSRGPAVAREGETEGAVRQVL